MKVDPRHSSVPKSCVVGVRGAATRTVVRSRFEFVLSLAVLCFASTLLWVGSGSGWLRFDVSTFSTSSEFLDKTVEALQRRPYDELARVDSSKETGGHYSVEYSVRRKRHEVLEIQAALIDRRQGTTLDRLVTWRSREPKN